MKRIPKITNIGGGMHGEVYKIGKNLAAKFPDDEEGYEEIIQEYGISKGLYKRGISVPKPYGIFNLRIPKKNEEGFTFSNKICPSFVMKYVPGIPIYLLKKDILSKATELANKEYLKVKEQGFVVWDAEGKNVLWNPLEEKIYLIDFVNWIAPNKN